MNEPDAALLERADDAMAESRRLCAQNLACVAEPVVAGTPASADPAVTAGSGVRRTKKMKRSVKKAKSKNWKAPSKRYRQVSMQQMIRDDIAELRALITKLLRNVKLN